MVRRTGKKQIKMHHPRWEFLKGAHTASPSFEPRSFSTPALLATWLKIHILTATLIVTLPGFLVSSRYNSPFSPRSYKLVQWLFLSSKPDYVCLYTQVCLRLNMICLLMHQSGHSCTRVAALFPFIFSVVFS